MTDTIDQTTLPIVARCDERERLRREAQARRAELAYLTFALSRTLDDRRRDVATLDAAVAWAREDIPPGESPEAFDLRANLVRMVAT